MADRPVAKDFGRGGVERKLHDRAVIQPEGQFLLGLEPILAVSPVDLAATQPNVVGRSLNLVGSGKHL